MAWFESVKYDVDDQRVLAKVYKFDLKLTIHMKMLTYSLDFERMLV